MPVGPSGAPPLLVVAGATATGKSGLAIEVAVTLRAEGVEAEIISADSRQVYRGLDIGTAKVPPSGRAGVPHHGLDLVDPDAPFSVADFGRHVRGVLSGLAARAEADGRPAVAILAGGTGLYLRAVAGGLDIEALPSDRAVRATVERRLEQRGLDASVERLRSLAPGIASRIDLANPRRVARALEIAEVAGDLPPPAARPFPGRVAWLGLVVEPVTHLRWIADRARAQFDAGLIEEARALRDRYDPALPAFSAIGYREAWAVIDGAIDRETAIERDAARNVAFAKRQRTWFRREPQIEWLEPGRGAVDRALAILRPCLVQP